MGYKYLFKYLVSKSIVIIPVLKFVLKNSFLVTCIFYLHRKIIEAGIAHLHWDGTFLFYLMPPLRSHYEALFKKHKERNVVWDGCSSDGTKQGVYREVSVMSSCSGWLCLYGI